jgi:urease accessory protein
MRLSKTIVPFAMAALFLTTLPTLAHVGTSDTLHFASGFTHPLRGLDHVLAMVAVGLYAYQLGGRNLWRVPAAFVVTMLAGGALGYARLPLPYVEQGIGLSVVVISIAIGLGVKIPSSVAMALVAAFAVFHGHSHGTEGMAADASFASYAIGFALSTLVLHGAGLALGFVLRRFDRRTAATIEQAAGVAGAIAGAAILGGLLPTS